MSHGTCLRSALESVVPTGLAVEAVRLPGAPSAAAASAQSYLKRGSWSLPSCLGFTSALECLPGRCPPFIRPGGARSPLEPLCTDPLEFLSPPVLSLLTGQLDDRNPPLRPPVTAPPALPKGLTSQRARGAIVLAQILTRSPATEARGISPGLIKTRTLCFSDAPWGEKRKSAVKMKIKRGEKILENDYFSSYLFPLLTAN